nr:unnamed protein product [Digitaria exilis]
MQSNIPSQTPQQGLPPHSSVSSQSVQPYQQGMTVSQQVHSQSSQPYTQHVQTSAGRPASHLAPPQQFQHQQPSTHKTQSPAAGRPIGQGSSELETHASRSGKPEIASNAADNTAVSENKNNGADSALMRPTTSQSLGDENMNNKQNGVGGVRKDPSGHMSQQNAGMLGPYVPPGMGQQHPSGPDVMIPRHMMHPGHKNDFSENIRPPLQQPYGLFHSGMTSRPLGENQIQIPMSQPGGVRHGDAMIRPHLVGPLPGHNDAMLPPFVDHLGQPPVGGRAFQEEGFNASGEHLRSRAAYPGRHDNMEDGLKQFQGPAHLDGQGLHTGPRLFERALGRPDGFFDSLQGRPPFPNQRSPFPVGPHEDFSRKPNTTSGHPDFLSHGAEFDQHRANGMPIFRNPGPFAQGMSGSPHGPRQDQLGSGNLPGNLQQSFGGPDFPPTRFNPGDSFPSTILHAFGLVRTTHWTWPLHFTEPSSHHFAGHMHPVDPNLVADYAHHAFPKESAHFGLAGPLRNGNIGWCRICMFNCGSAENLDLHVQTREHQQCAMDIVLQMKQDVAKRQKL